MSSLYDEAGILDVPDESGLFFAIAGVLLSRMKAIPSFDALCPEAFSGRYVHAVRESGYILLIPSFSELNGEKCPDAPERAQMAGLFAQKLAQWYSCLTLKVEDVFVIFTELDLSPADDGPCYPQAVEALTGRIQLCLNELQKEQGFSIKIVASKARRNLLNISEVFQEVLFSVDQVTRLYPNLNVISFLTPLKRIPDTTGLLPKPDLEKMYINAVLEHDFTLARNITREIILRQSASPATALSIRLRVDHRTAWTITLLGLPRNQSFKDCVMIFDCQASIGTSKTIDRLLENLDRFFALLERYYRHVPMKLSEKIDRIADYIKANYFDHNLSLASLCDEFGTSPSHLSRTFATKTGINVSSYIHMCRIERAKEFLGHTDMGLPEIAEKVGYPGDWALIRAFKRYHGMTPGKYRGTAGQ